MKRLFLLAAAAAILLPSSSSAQVADSVTIEVLAPPAAVTIEAPARAYRGDTITVAYQCVDEDQTPTFCTTAWSVDPPNRATIIEQTDSTVSVVLEQSGRVVLRVLVDRMDRLVIGARFLEGGLDAQGDPLPDGSFQWQTEGPFRLTRTGSAELCLVGLAGEKPLFVSSGACYENLETLAGFVPPLSDLDVPWRFGPPAPVRRAHLPRWGEESAISRIMGSYVHAPVRLWRELASLAGIQ